MQPGTFTRGSPKRRGRVSTSHRQKTLLSAGAAAAQLAAPACAQVGSKITFAFFTLGFEVLSREQRMRGIVYAASWRLHGDDAVLFFHHPTTSAGLPKKTGLQSREVFQLCPSGCLGAVALPADPPGAIAPLNAGSGGSVWGRGKRRLRTSPSAAM